MCIISTSNFNPQCLIYTYIHMYIHTHTSLVAHLLKSPPAVQETWVWSLGWEYPLEKEMAIHSSILAWRIPWTSLVGYSPWGHKESDTTKWLTFTFSYTHGFPDGSDGIGSTRNMGNSGFDPWFGKIPWRRAWQPTPVFSAGESLWAEEPGGLQSIGSQSQTPLSD